MSDPPLPIPKTAEPRDVLRAALEALDRGESVVVASVVARHGSAPSTPGQKLAFFGAGTAVGTIGGGAVERAVLLSMRAALNDPARGPRMETFRLGAKLGMCCGGSVEILVEPLRPERSALIIGAGHVGKVLAPLVASLGFRVTLADSREEAADPQRFAPYAGSDFRIVLGEYDDPEVLEGFPAALAGSAVLVMTHDHQVDQAAIEWALGRGFGFVGGVGSRAKAARTRTRLEAKGFSRGDIERVRMPVGAVIGARSPAEIAVAIAADLIAWRAGHAAVLLDTEAAEAPEAAE